MKTDTLSLRYCLRQSEDTEQLAAQLSVLCRPPFVMFLKGPLGSGKTTFARGFIKKLSGFRRIKSPTYTLIEHYPVSSYYILHCDFYRINDPEELETLGVRDYTLTPAIWLIEWPEHAIQNAKTAVLPSPDIVFCFSLLSNSHELHITSQTEKGYKILMQLKDIEAINEIVLEG